MTVIYQDVRCWKIDKSLAGKKKDVDKKTRPDRLAAGNTYRAEGLMQSHSCIRATIDMAKAIKYTSPQISINPFGPKALCLIAFTFKCIVANFLIQSIAIDRLLSFVILRTNFVPTKHR
jgi:hypothetical protein